MSFLPSVQLAGYNHSLSASENARAEQVQSLGLLLTSGQGSDLTITCGDQTFHVHSVIMCSRSDYFAIHRNASTRFQASDIHHVHLPGENPDLIEKMIRFIYTSDYCAFMAKESISPYTTQPKSLPVHASMYGLGEFYGIRSLKWVAAGKFKQLLELLTETKCFLFQPDLLAFIQAIKAVYTTTPDHDRVLRDSVIQYIPENLLDIFQFVEFRELVNGVPQFVEEAFSESVFQAIADSGTPRGEMERFRKMCALAREGKWTRIRQ